MTGAVILAIAACGVNVFLVFLLVCLCVKLAQIRDRDDAADIKIKTLEGHIATLQRVIAALIDLRDEVQRAHRLAQAIAESVAKPKTGLAPTPVTLTPPNGPRKPARANPANLKGVRK